MSVLATFKRGSNFAVAAGLWQHSYGQKLIIQGLELPVAIEVHFSFDANNGDSETEIGITKDGITTVAIPEQFLENDITGTTYEIYAFIYMSNIEEGETIKRVTMPVKCRPKIHIPIETENDRKLFREAIVSVNKSSEDAINAATSSEAWAHGHADYPERDDDNAKYYAGEARKDAEQTNEDRKSVSALAEHVDTVAMQVDADKTETEQYKSQAVQSAVNALQSEQAAKTSETAAREAMSGAEAAEGQAELFANQTAEDKSAVEAAKTLIMQMGQEVSDNKTSIDRTVSGFELLHQQAVEDINNAGQAQAEWVEGAGGQAVKDINSAGAAQISAINSSGEQQIKAVEDAGAAQVSSVQEAAADIIADRDQISENKNGISELKGDLEISLLENDRLYEGTNLAEKFKDEIANYSDIWQWIKARIKAGNFTGIHVNDYIRWQTTDNKWIESCVAGINTYKRYGDREVPNHIDFISKDLWPILHVMNPVDYNNGIIPTENLSGDGTKTAFILTNEMAGIASVTIGGTATTAYIYDVDTHTITFTDAPAAGANNIVVTGTGSECPWLASDLYLYANSLKGHVAGGTSKTSPVKLVDYTKDGIWSKLPEALKAVIVTKRALLPKRYSASGVLLNTNDAKLGDMGKLWIPSEVEVFGCGAWANEIFEKSGFIQYPIFNCNARRVKGLGDGGDRGTWWLLSSQTGGSESFCAINLYGIISVYIASGNWVGLPVCFRIS